MIKKNGIVPEEKHDDSCIIEMRRGYYQWNACRSEVNQRVVTFGKRLERIIENSNLAKTYRNIIVTYSGDMLSIAEKAFVKMKNELAQTIKKELEGKRNK